RLLENFREVTRRCGQVERDGKAWVSFCHKRKRDRKRPPQRTGDFEIYHRRLSSFYDPEQVFFHLFSKEPVAFWLDSSRAEPGLSRFSFMGGNDGPHSESVAYRIASTELTVTQAGKVRQSKQTIFDYLDRKLGSLRVRSDELPFDFNCGFVGYFGYELKAECGASNGHHSMLPDAEFVLADRIIAFDHLEQCTYLLCFDEKGEALRAERWLGETERKLRDLPSLPEVARAASSGPVTFRLNRSHQTYLDDIRSCQQHIKEGETYEICLTNQISASCSVDPLDLYRNLRRINPAPYAAYIRFNEAYILSSSPERFLRAGLDGWVESKPIKGTRPRGRTPSEDDSIREELRNSSKDRSENLMIVDLLRNDLGRVCEVGSIHVPTLMQVETYETVHQLVSTIRGRLSGGRSVIDCIRRAFPGGSMTGAPKLRTMEIMDQFERQARGVYSGAIGFLGFNGTADLNIVIRTIVMTQTCANIGAGGAIVALSDPESEFQEMLLKASALIQAIALTAHGRYEQSRYRSFEELITLKGSATL
ncbi:MAG TPA: aminodeoxychorismate synthase component I, partial [Pyrinomonadaceae bacterium]|nr:aminodeoxychorismate synthase component I [Pyrinomonadaceae bacterium]